LIPSLTPIHSHKNCKIIRRFLQYLSKYASIKRATSIWNVQRQTNAYMVNRRPLKFAGAYLNTQESEPIATP
ncbi:hypothetical protein T03_13596, partial [Trichinella britovi]